MRDTDLHHPDGTHRSTWINADGRQLTQFEDATIKHRADGHTHDMYEIHSCVMCGRSLWPGRVHVDTCSEVCFKRLVRQQREGE